MGAPARGALLLLAVAFLVAYAWPVLDPEVSGDARTYFDIVSWTVWGAFAIDFAIRIALADPRRSYLVGHWYDVLLVRFRCSVRCGYCGFWRSCVCSTERPPGRWRARRLRT